MNAKTYSLVIAPLLAIPIMAFASSSSASHAIAQEPKQATEVKLEPQSQQLIGTWKLEEASTPGSPSGVGTRLRMFTGTHWCIIQPDPKTGVIVFQHGGRYKFDGDTLTTTRDFAGESTKNMIGQAGKFRLKIDGDIMKQTDSKGMFNETWRRIE